MRCFIFKKLKLIKFYRACFLFTTVNKITFHWIPGHTDNQYHSYADHLAYQAAASSRTPIDPVRTLVYTTDASASGWDWPIP